MIASAAAAVWATRAHGPALGRRVLVTAGLGATAAVALLWHPANIAFLWVQLAGLVLWPLWLGVAVWLGFLARRRRRLHATLAGAAAPVAAVCLVLATRTLWIWTC